MDDSRLFVEKLALTGKFTRTANSQILYEVRRGDYVAIATRGAFEAILEDEGITPFNDCGHCDGHGSTDAEGTEECGRCDGAGKLDYEDDDHWAALQSYKHLLPRTGGQPTPAPVSA